jgi:PhnB protein
MPKRSLAAELDRLLDAMLAPNPELEPLAKLAADLRDLPDPKFKERLKNNLLRSNYMNATATAPALREGYHTVTPYITSYHAAELIDFVKATFGAQETERVATPGGLHAELRIGDSMLMIGGGPNLRGEPMPTSLHYYVPDIDAVYRRALDAGATSLHDPREDHGDRFASVKDAYGNQWYISTHLGPKYVPQGLRDITVYLHPVGAPKLIEFMKAALGAEEVERFASPEGEVYHAKLRIGDSMVELGEAHGPWEPMPTMFYLYVPDVDALYARAIQAGAASISVPVDQPYGDRTGAVLDAFGNQWFIATPTSAPTQPPKN